MSDAILKLQQITKSFPGVKALDNVHFELKRGEIHGLMGENGAGKSTFIKIITGVYIPDSGEIILEGKQVSFHNPRDAQTKGIAAIYQHVTCYPDLSVTENIFMGHEITHKAIGWIDWKTMHSLAQELLDQLEARFSSRSRMGDLSVAQQQIVEIAKALSLDAKIIIMDEPTAALSRHESQELYRITRDLRQKGTSVIFISHRMEDIIRLADRVTVLRDSQYIGTWTEEELNQEKLVKAMVGRELTQLFPKRKIHPGKEILRIENLGRTGHFKDVSFGVRSGEMVAVTGLVGAGRTELCESIYGIVPADSGRIMMDGREVRVLNPIQALELGIGYLPEDRQLQGLVMDWPIVKNITLPHLEHFTKGLWMDERLEIETADDLVTKLSVKAPDIHTTVSTLSGGNQQKAVAAKILTRELKVIILDEPTKGVDIGAKAAIYEIMEELAEQGYAIIFVSSEMPEVLGLSDRVVVMKEGRMTALLDTDEIDQEEILHAAMVVDTQRSADIGTAE